MSDESRILTNRDLAEIRAREQKATPGPWYWRILGQHGPTLFGARTKVVVDSVRKGMQGATLRFRDFERCLMDNSTQDILDAHPDARLIAASRTDVPRLLDMVEWMLPFVIDLDVEPCRETHARPPAPMCGDCGPCRARAFLREFDGEAE